jgi:hypothetical protein
VLSFFILLFLGIGSLTAPSAAARAPGARYASAQYTIRVATFPHFAKAGPIVGVDALGDMAGIGYETGDQYANCVYFNGVTVLDLTARSGSLCHFTGMTAQGTAVGQRYDFSGYINYAVLYSGGQLSELESPLDAFLGVSDNGLVVGNLSVAGYAVYQLSTGSVLYDLYDQKGHCSMSYPYAINNSGVVLGYDQCRNGEIRYETVSNGTFDYFTPPPGYTVATDGAGPLLNNLNQIIIHGKTGNHVFLWSPRSQIAPHDLGALAEDPGGSYSVTALSATTAVGVTNDGYSWVWTAQTGMRNLASLLPANGYGWIQPGAVDARGDIGCTVAGNTSTWLYLKAP